MALRTGPDEPEGRLQAEARELRSQLSRVELQEGCGLLDAQAAAAHGGERPRAHGGRHAQHRRPTVLARRQTLTGGEVRERIAEAAKVRLPRQKLPLDAVQVRIHLRVMREVFDATGPRRMGLGASLLEPIQAEMRRRSLEADCWSMEHLRRSNEAFGSGLN